MKKTQTGSHRAGLDPHVSQEGALARLGPVTGGTSLEWPDPIYGKNYMNSYHVLQFDDTDAGNFWHYRQGQTLDYMYEHMASVGSLDVVNLPTLSADTKMFLPRDDFTNQNQR